MSCDSIRPWLEPYFDGELPGVRHWQVRRHLQCCTACSHEVRGLSRLRAALLAADVAPHDTANSVPGCLPPRKPGLRRTAVAAALTLAVAVSMLLSHGRSYGDPLDEAIAGLANAPAWKSSHVIVRNRAGKRVREQWVILPDTVRDERYEGDQLTAVTVQLGRRTIHYRPQQKLAVEAEGNLFLPEQHGVGVFHGPVNTLRHLRTTAEKIGGVTVTERANLRSDGRLERMFTIAIDVARHYPGDPALRGIESLRHVVSIDGSTGRLVRWEDPRSGLTYEVDRYDQGVSTAMFDRTPPAGSRIASFGDWWATRSHRTVGTDTSMHEVIVHAVDAAANGDLWLTVSRRAPEKSARITDWPTRGMLAQDERGRAYVQFVTLGNANWPKHGALLGFTPVKPRSNAGPPPRRLSVQLLPKHQPHQRPLDHLREMVHLRNLPIPEAASWETPPLNLLDVLGESAKNNEWMAPRRSHARRAYRADNPCGALG